MFLSKLTLGAVIGSYVQRQAPEARAARAAKAGEKNSAEAGSLDK